MASSYNDEFIISWLCKHVNSTGICRCCRAGKNLSSKLAILVLGFVFVILTYLLSHRTAGHSSARQVKFIPFQEALLWNTHRNHMKSYGSMSEIRFYYVFSRYVSLSYMLYAAFMRLSRSSMFGSCSFSSILSQSWLCWLSLCSQSWPRTRALGSATARLARLPRDDVFQKCVQKCSKCFTFRFKFFEFFEFLNFCTKGKIKLCVT